MAAGHHRLAAWFGWLPLALATGYAAWFWNAPIGEYAPLGADMMHGDSPSFFFGDAASPYRWMGYPLFLAGIEAAFGGVDAAPKAQLALLAAAVGFLGWALSRAFGGWCLACAVTVVVLGQCAVTRFHAYVLSEGLFVPLVCALLGVVALLISRPTPWRAACAAALCGLAIAARPAGLFLLAIWPPLFWFVWRRCAGTRWKSLGAAALALAACFTVEAALWRAVHGDQPRPSFANRTLFAKALMFDAEPTPAASWRRDAELTALLADARAVMAPLRLAVAEAPDWRSRAIALRNAEATAQIATFQRLFRGRLRDLAARRGVTVDALLADASRAALLARPLEWAANARVHWLALWGYYSINDAEFSRAYADYAAGLRDSPLLREALLTDPAAAAPEPRWLVWLALAVSGSAFWASVAVAALAIWQRWRRGRPDDDIAVAAVAVVAAHGYLLLAAMFNKALLRYGIAMWPAQALYGLLLSRWLWQRLRARGLLRNSRRQP